MDKINQELDMSELTVENVIPNEIFNDKKLFQKWFLTSYLTRFNEMPDMMLPMKNQLIKDRMENKDSYFNKVVHTVSISLFGKDESSRLFDKSRVRDLVTMRKLICYILVKKLGYPLTTVGRMMKKNHATVLYHCRCAEDHIKYDKNFQKIFSEIHSNLNKIGVKF